MFAACPAPWAAVLGSLLLGFEFVACLYVCASHKRSGGRAPNRNDDRVIKERFVRVGIASVLAPFIVWMIAALSSEGRSPCVVAPLGRWFGLWAPAATAATLLPLGLTMVLFLGPLTMGWLDRSWVDLADLLSLIRSQVKGPERLQLLRNLLIGPTAEEWVFRACMCPLLYGAGLADAANVFSSAVVFGLAHVHHRFDADTSWLAVAVQFTYTTLFGAYSSYLFLRTGLIYGPLLAHIFCNSMGLPDFGRVPGHAHSALLKAAFVVGLGSFVVCVTLDAIYRPRLFHSLFWAEALSLQMKQAANQELAPVLAPDEVVHA
jgi:prenyl protein peptidase